MRPFPRREVSMTKTAFGLFVLFTALGLALSTEAGEHSKGIIDHTVTSLEGDTVNLADYRGKALLIVNTASKCGYTPQYAGLQELWEKYRDRGLVVIAFPANDFGNQEPGTAKQIRNFCSTNFKVDFPMMSKVATKGRDQAPIYTTLTTETAPDFQGEIRWNFTKFLVDTEGRVVARFESSVDPMSEKITSAVEKVLPTAAK
jgi:glutathione peroxidase